MDAGRPAWDPRLLGTLGPNSAGRPRPAAHARPTAPVPGNPGPPGFARPGRSKPPAGPGGAAGRRVACSCHPGAARIPAGRGAGGGPGSWTGRAMGGRGCRPLPRPRQAAPAPRPPPPASSAARPENKGPAPGAGPRGVLDGGARSPCLRVAHPRIERRPIRGCGSGAAFDLGQNRTVPVCRLVSISGKTGLAAGRIPAWK